MRRRNVKIITLASKGARQLSKYDWPECLVYQTPATHILLNKEGIEVNGKEKLVSTGDKHVVVRPKQIVNIVRICKAETELAANSTRVNIREQQTLEEI